MDQNTAAIPTQMYKQSIDSRMHILYKKTVAGVPVDEIIMIKSESNYSPIFPHSKGKIFTSCTLKYWETMINDPIKFVRCHASFLVNIAYIHYYDYISKSLKLTDTSKILCPRSRWAIAKHLLR